MKKIALILTILTLVTCRNSNSDSNSMQDQLPAATQTGANTAGCNVNGQVLLPKNRNQSIGGQPSYGIISSVGPNFNHQPYGNDIWDLLFTNFDSKKSLSISIGNLSMGVGNYSLGQDNKLRYKDSKGTYISYDNSGQITITKFDYSAGIYSGTFSSSLKNNNNPSDIIDIKDGRFDINYATLNK